MVAFIDAHRDVYRVEPICTQRQIAQKPLFNQPLIEATSTTELRLLGHVGRSGRAFHPSAVIHEPHGPVRAEVPTDEIGKGNPLKATLFRESALVH